MFDVATVPPLINNKLVLWKKSLWKLPKDWQFFFSFSCLNDPSTQSYLVCKSGANCNYFRSLSQQNTCWRSIFLPCAIFNIKKNWGQKEIKNKNKNPMKECVQLTNMGLLCEISWGKKIKKKKKNHTIPFFSTIYLWLIIRLLKT